MDERLYVSFTDTVRFGKSLFNTRNKGNFRNTVNVAVGGIKTARKLNVSFEIHSNTLFL
jgi:hypothetical protein